MTEKLSLQLALVLPGVQYERDSCIQRLTDNLQAQGLEKVHVVQQDGKPFLCLHYDPTRTGLPQVRSMAEAAGAALSGRYQHELMRIDGMDCSTCVTVIEHALVRLDGVLEASVSYAAEWMRLEFDTDKVSRKAIDQLAVLNVPRGFVMRFEHTVAQRFDALLATRVPFSRRKVR
jgi:Zn2+/Cd2+-exporting ATPase